MLLELQQLQQQRRQVSQWEIENKEANVTANILQLSATTASSVFGSFSFANAVASSAPATLTTGKSLESLEPISGNNLFRFQFSDTSKPLFGSSFASSTPGNSIFGAISSAATTTSTPSFSNFSFGSALTPVSTDGTSTPANASASTPSFFGNSNSGLTFASVAQQQPSTETATDLSQNSASQISFADLAKQNNNNSFNTSGNAPPGGFFGLTTRDDFSNLSRPQGPKSNGSSQQNAESNDTETAEDPNYDPHYDPIIALPDEIEISTGEEQEKKLFSERAKLYRYDATNKEWKERGVGEFKVLHHPDRKSYRLLLRREQIHKCVLNMALTTDIQISPMKQSDKAFCWVATNFAEDTEKGELESLSVRFKNADIAARFQRTLNECLNDLRARGELEPEDD